MTFLAMPKKQKKERRVDSSHAVQPLRTKTAEIERAVAEAEAVATVAVSVADSIAEDVEKNVPVIRANHIVFSSGRTGRTRVLFY